MEKKKKNEDCEERKTFEECKAVITSTFPQIKTRLIQYVCYQYNKEPSWLAILQVMAATMTAQRHLLARPSDVFICGYPKCGTTWTKSLVYAVMNRDDIPKCTETLNLLSPHEIIPQIEFDVYTDDAILDLEAIPSPRILGTHVYCHLLHSSVLDSGSKVLYVCRDPKDAFVSYWCFIKKFVESEASESIFPLEEIFEDWCNGHCMFGSYWEHVVGFWNLTKNNSSSNNNNNNINKNVMFLKYEDMIKEPVKNLRRLGEFLERPFTAEEENEGVLEKIFEICSINSLMNSDASKRVKYKSHLKFDVSIRNDVYFRKGKVGDWKNHLSPEMADRLDEITKVKFSGSGITFSDD